MLCVALCVCTWGCKSHPRYRTKPIANTAAPQSKASKPVPAEQIGFSSFYANKYHGRPTASGEIFDMNGLSAAHRELPLGTIIKVTHLGNGKSVVVKVNDRGPFVGGRILDLSLGAAKKLDMVDEGVAQVKIEIVKAVE